MNIFTYILTILSSLTLGSHFMRHANYGLMLTSLIAIGFLFMKKKWLINVFSGLLFLGTVEWVRTTIEIYYIKIMIGEPYQRMIIIMLFVALISLISSILLLRKKFQKNFKTDDFDTAKIASFFTTFTLIAFPFLKMDFPILMLERFLPGFGWLQIFGLALYASFVTGKLLDKNLTSLWRRKIWMLFSIVFFTQFILGISGYEIFLMTGKLHLPVPGIILAGPLYRWSLSFMVFLFLGSIFFMGPAWCSYLCYFGVWDDIASRNKLKPKQLPKNRQIIRISVFIIVVLIAVVLHFLGVSGISATIFGITFGIIGVVIMVVYSRKKGVMTHCTLYCPIGLLAVTMGKVSPFRLRINSSCDECALCHLACRYDALNMRDIKNRKPNINCTLCGDCVGSCPHLSIEYKFFNLSPKKARAVFIVIAAAIHTAFLSIGRI